jgi:hypothetical protein
MLKQTQAVFHSPPEKKKALLSLGERMTYERSSPLIESTVERMSYFRTLSFPTLALVTPSTACEIIKHVVRGVSEAPAQPVQQQAKYERDCLMMPSQTQNPEPKAPAE